MTGAVVLFATIAAAVEAAPLFPEPLHIRREVHDPISETTATIDEYCNANRIVTVHGARVVIADYERGVLTEIDHTAATFSITPFRDVPQPHIAAGKSSVEPRVVAPKRSFDGRVLETYEFRHEAGHERMTVEITVDRQVTVSAEALEALIGASFPGVRTFVHDAMFRAAGPPGGGGRRIQTDALPSYALPAEQSITYELGGEAVTFRSTVIAIDREPPPPDLLLIPPGARRVESKLTAVPRMLQEIERVP